MIPENETAIAKVTEFSDEALRVLAWLRCNGMLATDERAESLAERYAFNAVSPFAKEALATVKARQAEIVAVGEADEAEAFELAYSVQIDSGKMLELLVDEIESGDCYWQITNASGQILSRSERYMDQALCLRDGLNKALV